MSLLMRPAPPCTGTAVSETGPTYVHVGASFCDHWVRASALSCHQDDAGTRCVCPPRKACQCDQRSNCFNPVPRRRASLSNWVSYAERMSAKLNCDLSPWARMC